MGWNGHVVRLHEGDGVTIDQSDPGYPMISASGGGGGGIASVVAGQNILIDDTDAANPVVSVGVAAPGQFGLALIPGVGLVLASDSATSFQAVEGSITIQTDSGQTSINMQPGLIDIRGPIVQLDSGVFIPAKFATGSLPDATTVGEGAIAYDTATHSLAISDGTIWKHIAAV